MATGTSSRIRRAVLTVALAATAVILVAPGAASAATDDSFTVTTTDGCGSAEFVDHGPGAAGGGDNDDYLVIHDYCGDGHGVAAGMTLNNGGNLTEYNGDGLAGPAKIWDPFRAPEPDDVRRGDKVLLRVCLYDGPSDETGAHCVTGTRRSTDG
jgi:hypothetical protein